MRELIERLHLPNLKNILVCYKTSVLYGAHMSKMLTLLEYEKDCQAPWVVLYFKFASLYFHQYK